MGRTGRKRRRKLKLNVSHQKNLDNEPKIINLKQWLSQLGWKNHSKLKLTYFENSGRGLSSTLRISPYDRLISIPYEAMVTYISLEFTEVYDVLKRFPDTFTIQEAFTMFLCLEKHKNERSKWKVYLDTLPEVVPIMPWGCKSQELNLLPDEILKIISKYHQLVANDFKKLNFVLRNQHFLCTCCKRPLYEIITKEKFYESYVLFLTRCVYIHYKHLKRFSRKNVEELLTNEPNMVLCPLFDMFNHSTDAEAELQFEDGIKSCYLHVITKCSFSPGSELYFSYDKHDNLSLFCYYGFYLPNNSLDFIVFTKEDIELLTFSKYKWSFVCEKKFNENLIWHLKEPSFNLTAIAYISSSKDEEWKTKVFTQNFSDHDRKEILITLRLLLQRRIFHFSEKLVQMENFPKQSESLVSIIGFCKYRLGVMKRMYSDTM